MRNQAVILATMMVLFISTTTGAKYSGGTGEPNGPYKIGKVEDWQELIGASADWSKHFILTSDIDFNEINLTPVAPDTDPANSSFQGIPFAGAFDGNDHVLRNAVINLPSSDYIGLFGLLGYGSYGVRNLGVENITVTGRNCVGGLCGGNGGTISGCYATGNVTAGDNSRDLGVLCGASVTPGATISDCYATGNVTGGDKSWYLGVLCGLNHYGTISACFATGSVSSGIGSQCLGGLCGYNRDGYITDCYATGTVTSGGGSQNLGGLCGYNYWSSGIGKISDCYATGKVNGGDDSQYLGGLCGSNWWGTISSCYATGKVGGGGGSQLLGGLCGHNLFGTISACFWDIQTSDCNSSAGGTGKTTAEMKIKSTFTDAGWDFIEIWSIGEHQTYPFLRFAPAGDLNYDKKVDLLDFAIFADHWLKGD